MTTLRVIIDNLLRPGADSSEQARYTRALTRALIATAPPATQVRGVVAAHGPGTETLIDAALPELTDVEVLSISPRQMDMGWRYGIPPKTLGDGLTHSPTMLAPLFAHDRTLEPHNQTVATLHDLTLWLRPETLSRRDRWAARTQWRRAVDTLDALVVTSNYAANLIDSISGIGDRIQVVTVAPIASASTTATPDAPVIDGPYVAVNGDIDDATLLLVLTALDRLSEPVGLILLGESATGGQRSLDPTVAARIAQAKGRLLRVGIPGQPSSDSALAGALVYLALTLEDTIGMRMLDAMALGVPVVHTDNPVLDEISADAARLVPADESFVDTLTGAVQELVSDERAAGDLALQGRDRAQAFSWAASANNIWRLHADI